MTMPSGRKYPVNGVQMAVRINDVGQESVVVMGMQLLGSPILTTAQAVDWLDAFWSSFRPLIVGTASCVGATVRDVSEANGVAIEVPAPSNATGSGGASRAVAAACTLIKWSTAAGGRSGKGRTYLPGISQSQVGNDGRTYQAGYASTVQTAIGAYLGSSFFSGPDRAPAVLSFTKGEAVPIEGGSLAPLLGIQRRRMR